MRIMKWNKLACFAILNSGSMGVPINIINRETQSLSPHKVRGDNVIPHRSEGFPRTGYFVPGRDGIGVWPDSEIVRSAASSSLACRSLTNIF